VDVAPALTDAQENALKKELEFRTTKYFFGRVDVYLGPQRAAARKPPRYDKRRGPPSGTSPCRRSSTRR